MRKYTLVAVVCLLAGVGRAAAQAPAEAVVTPVKGAWTPHVIATSRPVSEVEPASPAAIQPVRTQQPPPNPLRLVTGAPKEGCTEPLAGPPRPPAAPAGPCLVVERSGPATVALGQPLAYEIIVRNVGAAEAQRVRVEEQLPPGASVTGAEPRPQLNGTTLAWDLGGLAAGAEARLRVAFRPAAEGDLSATATVSCATTSALHAKVTRPSLPANSGLSVSVTDLPPAQPGQKVTFQIHLANNTPAPQRNVLLRARLSAGLRHPEGSRIEAVMPALAPGEVKLVPLEVVAAEAGRQTVTASIIMQGVEASSAEAAVDVGGAVTASPAAGAAPVSHGADVRPPVAVPPLVPPPAPEAPHGRPEPAPGPPLPPLTELPRQESRAAPPPSAPKLIASSGGPVRLDLAGAEPALEVGREATYEIRVLNQGAAPSRDVLVRAVVPDEMALLSADGPTGRRVSGQEVAFEPLASLDGQAVYRVRVKAVKPGDGHFTARLQCAAMDRPASQQVSTLVYSGEESGSKRAER